MCLVVTGCAGVGERQEETPSIPCSRPSAASSDVPAAVNLSPPADPVLLADAAADVIDSSRGRFHPSGLLEPRRMYSGSVRRFERGEIDGLSYEIDYTVGSGRVGPGPGGRWTVKVDRDEMDDNLSASVGTLALYVGLQADGIPDAILVGGNDDAGRGNAIRIDRGVPFRSEVFFYVEPECLEVFEALSNGDHAVVRYWSRGGGEENIAVDLSGFNQAVQLAIWMMERRK